MANEEWLGIARNYSLLSDAARADYWKQLAPEHQAALREALILLASSGGASPATRLETSPRARRGCGSPIAAGCVGIIVGCVLTVGAELAAIMMGVHAVSDAFRSVSGGSSSGGASSGPDDQGQAVEQPDPLDPMSPEGMAWRKRHQEELDAERRQRQRENGEVVLDDPGPNH